MTTDTTAWTASVSGATPTASLTVSQNGGAAKAISLKGMCYSPCPLNSSNEFNNLGDWFWDSFSGTGYGITNWAALWQRDLPNIRALGVNTIRVYSMISRQLVGNGQFPSPAWDSGQLFTHTEFLDACWNDGKDPLYVLVGLPLPPEMLKKADHDRAPQAQLDFWTNVLTETVTQLAAHPAVLGFTIQNELDGENAAHGVDTTAVDFWWSRVETLAAAVKTAMGSAQKIVGMAVHDDPKICGLSASHMAQCPSLDFWGVNSYQTVNFDSIFGASGAGPGYGAMTGAALKPVILTEWGMPATTHTSPSDPSTITANDATIAKTASTISTVVPKAYDEPLCLGLYYFEYCDEWWNQGGAPNIHTWWGGAEAGGLPNGFWDQDGFGLYSIARGSVNGIQLADDADPWIQNFGYGKPNVIDVHTPRAAAVAALKTVF